MLGFVCRTIGNTFGRAVGDMICPGVGGEIGGKIGTWLGNAYAGIAGDPTAWTEGLSFEAECIENLGSGPLNIL